MTTLAQARKALNEAHILNTAEAWQLAALAFAAASEAKSRKPVDRSQVKHTGKTPIMHVGRCTLADGYSVRVSVGQFKGETIADSLARLERFARDCFIADHQPSEPTYVDRAIATLAYAETMRNSPDTWARCMDAVAHYRQLAKENGPKSRPFRLRLGLGEFDRNIPVPETVECRIVKHGSGPDAGVDLEDMPMMAAAE